MQTNGRRYARLTVAAYGAGLLLCAAAGFCFSPAAGAAAAGTAFFFGLLAFLLAAYRRREMRRLADEMDALLHGRENIRFERYEEGELAVLADTMKKLTVRLQENAGRSAAERKHLADSMANVAHQLRTPLTSLNLLVPFLAEPGLPEERRLGYTRELQRLLDRTDWLIASLLKLSRLDAGTLTLTCTDVRVQALFDRALQALAIPLELRGQRTVQRLCGDECFKGDLAWSAEALGNILKNCMEHTPDGGTLTLAAHMTALYTQITVQDTGSGIDPADLPHLFERFYKGHGSAPESAGIGLALARGILAQENGTLKAENAPEGGALFTLRFYKNATF